MPRELNKPLPSLIIGLGGSGAVTINHIKRQLLDMYNNTLPDTVRLLVFDTTTTPMSQFTEGQPMRQSGEGYGEVGFDGLELGYIGGNTHNMAQEVRNGQRPHIGSWFDAGWYLDNVPDLLQFGTGAGQFRQLGRLALFRDVASTGESQFYSRVNGHIGAMRGILSRYYNADTDRALAVFIVGSLMGGTGAGTFIDTAFLVRKIAAAIGVDVKIRGFFYLPEAFKGTRPAAEINTARGRAFAALRELRRFAIQEFDKELGYPIHYHDSGSSTEGRIWRAELKDERLYELLYLVDGVRNRQPLNTVPLRSGVATSIADSIIAYIDSQTGSYMQDYTANVANAITTRQTESGREAYVGSLGTYTLRLPMTQIVDAWGFELALDALKILFPAEEFSDTTGAPVSLVADQNQERITRAEAEAQELLRSRTPLPNPRDPSDAIQPTQLWVRIEQWYGMILEDESRMAGFLGTRSADEWTNILVPGDGDRRAQMSLRKTQSVLNTRVDEKIQLSNEINEDYSDAPRRIQKAVEQLFDRHLGMLRTSGKRDGGDLRTALDDFVTLQIDRWRSAMEAYVMFHLNGQPESDIHVQRGGKLGWLVRVQYELETILKQVSLTLKDVALNPQVIGRRRAQVMNAMDNARQHMIDEKDNAGILGRGGNALQAQRAYREAVEEAFNFYRAEIARELVHYVITQMLAYTQSIIEQLEQWVATLTSHQESLFARMVSGSKQVDSELYSSEKVASREVIRDRNWERATYQKYVNQENALNTVLESIQWEANQSQAVDGSPLLRVKLRIDDNELAMERSGTWSDKNRRALLRYCRSVFDPALEQESVLHYLASASTSPYVDDPVKLARELIQESGQLLSLDGTRVGEYQRNFLLLAYNDGKSPEDRRFIDDVIEELRKEYGVPAEDESRAKVLPSDDPFRMMLVSMAEVLPLEYINDYDTCRTVYDTVLDPGQRSRLHIMPSEVQSIKYELNLPNPKFDLAQKPRILTPRVAMLMEKPQAFRQFLALFAHNVIAEASDPNNTSEELYYYRLAVPTDNGTLDEWWLTPPSSTPSMLNALITFVFRRRDVGYETYQPGYTKLLTDRDLKTVENILNLKREQDTDQRMASGEIGYNDEMLQIMEEYANTPTIDLLGRMTVEYDCLHELREWMLSEITELNRLREETTGATKAELTELYDLYSISSMLVKEMMHERLLSAKRTAGRKISVQDNLWIAQRS